MKFKKQRNHILCGFGKEKKKFVLSDEVRQPGADLRFLI